MAITEIPRIMTLLSIASAILLLFFCWRFRARRSPIDLQYQRTLDRRLRELREECVDPSTLRAIAEQTRLILDRRKQPLCLPSPHSGFKDSKIPLPSGDRAENERLGHGLQSCSPRKGQ
jgi:hypothetical protein